MQTSKGEKVVLGIILVLVVCAAILGISLFLKWSNDKDKELMAIDYCFTETGEHYQCN